MTVLSPFRHTRKRLYERYSLRIARPEYEWLSAEIARLLPCLETWQAEGARVIVQFPYGGQVVRWVFCPFHRLIITALFPHDRPKADAPRTAHQFQGSKRRNRSHPRPYQRPKAQWEEE